MAKDVNHALVNVISSEGEMMETEAHNFLQTLEHSNRYQKDVWIT